MVRNLFGRIVALWRAAAALAAGKPPGAATAGKAETMSADRLAGAAGTTAGGTATAPDDNLFRAMICVGIDVDDFAMREALLLHDMRLICRPCNARSRCRRDLATGDFTRRYRHYCPNATVLALVSAMQRHQARFHPPKGRSRH